MIMTARPITSESDCAPATVRILITASTLPRWKGDFIPAFVLDQAIALRCRYPDLDIEIIAPHHAGAAVDEVMDGITVHRFRYFWPSALARLAYPAILPNLRQRPWLALQVPFLIAAEFTAVLRAARRRRPNVIYSHWFTPQAIIGAAVGGLLDIPHVFTTHSIDVQVLRALPAAGPALVRRVTRSVRAGTAVSRRTLAKLQAFFPDPVEWQRVAGKLRVVPMGVNAAQFRPGSAGQRDALRAALGLTGTRVVLFLGRLTEVKGVPCCCRRLRNLLQYMPTSDCSSPGKERCDPPSNGPSARAGSRVARGCSAT